MLWGVVWRRILKETLESLTTHTHTHIAVMEMICFIRVEGVIQGNLMDLFARVSFLAAEIPFTRNANIP